MDCCRRTIWIIDAHRGDGTRFVIRADEKLTAFVELESAIRGSPKLDDFRFHFGLSFAFRGFVNDIGDPTGFRFAALLDCQNTKRQRPYAIS